MMMLIWPSGSGLKAVDKDSMGRSGFLAVTFFKKSSDSKRES